MRKDRRAFIFVLDSFGVGAAPDAAKFGDEGSDTFGHIAKACAEGKANGDGLRDGALRIPHLLSLGLGEAHKSATGSYAAGVEAVELKGGFYGAAAEKSYGKDTPSGHWEMAGLPVEWEWGFFPDTSPCFPEELVNALIDQGGLPGVLGNVHSSGTVILDALGEEHIRTGKPIIYTSADSVFQIAAHEKHFGLDRLYELSYLARKLVDEYNVGRVIARPFTGECAGDFKRTGNRKDLAVPPSEPTLLLRVEQAGGNVISIGKIGDIFAHQGTGKIIKATGNAEIMEKTLDAIKQAVGGSLVVSNFVDFDMEYGHRRNVAGYAAALEHFDRYIPAMMAALKPGDIVFLTADHGCDPTWSGTDHTREYVPVLAFGPSLPPINVGLRETFADIGQTIASHLGIDPLNAGVDLYGECINDGAKQVRRQPA
ncbi:MAG: phosphopentomutase [Alphaproteobacteria bacterium]|nr:phosphopentomutase [Alphaproteobacteria bacterium]